MRIDNWAQNIAWKKFLVCAWGVRWQTITPSAGTEIAGVYCGKKFVRGFVELRVEIERRLDGSHWLRYRGRYLHLRPCPEPARQPASPSGLRPPGLAKRIPKPQNKIKPKYHVPADHPWRRPWKRTFLSCEKPDISTLR